MKKLITICLLMATAFTVNAQTREETISWLKEKLSRYIISKSTLPDQSIKLESIDECTFVIYFTGLDLGKKYFLRQTFPTEGLYFNEKGDIFYNNTVIASQCSQYTGTTHEKSTFLFQLENREDKIRERVKKALDHLATFCPKKKETF